MPLHENSIAPTAFICFWGVYEWTRVPKCKKLYLGFDTMSFVGHELDATGINISQKRIQSIILLKNQPP